MNFTISLRTWVAGEAFSSSGAWVTCSAGTEYSLTALSGPGGWKACQTNKMYCYGGSHIGPKPGYWRSSNKTDNFIACLYAPACLGYESKYNNTLGAWFEGYQGYLCADCEAGYSRSGEYECAKCPNPILNVLQLVGILFWVTVGIVIMIRSTLTSALQRKNIQSVYIKILMNHLQLIVLTASFDFDWPNAVLELFDSTEPVATVSTHILSFDCFLDTRSDNNDSNMIRLYYQKMIMYTLLPIILGVISSAFWSLYYCKKSTAEKMKKRGRIMASLIILFFLIHPSIVEYMFSNFK